MSAGDRFVNNTLLKLGMVSEPRPLPLVGASISCRQRPCGAKKVEKHATQAIGLPLGFPTTITLPDEPGAHCTKTDQEPVKK